MRNSRIILAKGIKMDRDYNNVLRYTEDEIVALCSEDEHVTATGNNFSFIRNRGTIATPFGYGACIQSNYVCFQNPDYNNKWFFAWIDEVTYKSDNCTEIGYTVDEFSTWWDYWTRATCFVEREHPVSDTIGENTNPEPVELGADYVCTNTGIFKLADMNTFNMRWGMLVTGSSDKEQQTYNDVVSYNGVLSGLHPVMGIPITDTNSIKAAIKPYVDNGVEDRIVRMFQYPTLLGDATGAKQPWSSLMSLPANSDVDGYTPQFNKLLTYPYKFLRLSTSDGDSVDLHFELFNDGGIVLRGTVFPTSQFKAYPKNYGGVEDDYSNAVFINTDVEVSWLGDSYKQWLANSKVSEALGFAVKTIGAGVQAVTGAAVGNPLAVGGAALNIGAAAGQVVNDVSVARNQSSKVHGQSTGNGIAIAEGSWGFTVQVMSIRAEYAKRIDEYFDKYGYATNRLKTPNLDSSSHNFVKISSDSCIGYGDVPANSMSVINSAFRRGVTLWSSHSGLGNY